MEWSSADKTAAVQRSEAPPSADEARFFQSLLLPWPFSSLIKALVSLVFRLDWRPE